MLILEAVMHVSEDKPVCASCVYLHQLYIEIYPKPVEAFKLTGREVYNSNGQLHNQANLDVSVNGVKVFMNE